MEKIICQRVKNTFVPVSPEDQEKANTFPENKFLKCIVTGTTKARSIIQLNTFFACCKYVADNVKEYDLNHPKYTDGSYWNTKKKVAFQCKVAIHFVDDSQTIVYKNEIRFHYRSISVDNLKHLEACKFFDRAFELLALRIGVNTETLVNEAKSLMLSKER